MDILNQYIFDEKYSFSNLFTDSMTAIAYNQAIKNRENFATYINAKKVGRNFTIKNNVTIGNNNDGNKPVIGNNVTIHVNCVIFHVLV